MNYFKSEEANRLYKKWISNSPDSYHQLDMERFYDLIICLVKEKEGLRRDMIEESLGEILEQNEIDIYMDKYETIAAFYRFLIKRSLV